MKLSFEAGEGRILVGYIPIPGRQLRINMAVKMFGRVKRIQWDEPWYKNAKKKQDRSILVTFPSTAKPETEVTLYSFEQDEELEVAVYVIPREGDVVSSLPPRVKGWNSTKLI